MDGSTTRRGIHHFLKRHQAPPNGTIGGLITFGSKDYRNCNPIWTHTTLNARVPNNWDFETTNFSIGNEVVSEATRNVWRLLQIVKAPKNHTLQLYTVKCSTVNQLPDLVFNISGKPFPVPAYQYVNNIPGEDQNCELAVEMSPEEVYILGNPFLRTYCSYFDYAGQRIGFSIAKQPDFK
uniref:Peptidase A1 domain-containing protein n=1 Tax=Ditylenchus dipsaci TaxID=166011 RepID=A0A915E112_9BILA